MNLNTPSKSSRSSLTEQALTLPISIMCSVIEMAKIMKETFKEVGLSENLFSPRNFKYCQTFQFI